MTTVCSSVPSRPRRRTWLRALLAVVAVLVLGVAAFAVWIAYAFTTADVDTVGEVSFDRPLAIPPLADSEVVDGVRVFDLPMTEGTSDLGRDERTPTWGFDGGHLGPTLRAERGERVAVRVTNDLPETSTVHWHGMHLPAAMDGGPHQPIEPGETWEPTWRIDQPAASLWYHPHPHGETARHVYRGLAGMFLLDDPAASPAADALPDTYGVDDVPVMVQDVRFDGSELEEDASLLSSTGLLGDTVLVNGTPGPYLDVATERVRLRLLNASGARIYRFRFDDDRTYDVVGSDGGLLPETVRTDQVVLTPGERAEIVVELTPGEDVVLRSEPLGARFGGRFQGAEDRFDVLQLRAADDLRPSPAVPDELAPAPDLDPGEVTTERVVELAGTTINGRQMDMGRIDHASRVDATERWTVRNVDGQPHNFHVHDAQFAVESLDGDPPPPELAGWKDTVYVAPQTEARLLLRFTDHTDPDTPYMFHCHLLRHEDQGMMGQFVVVDASEARALE